jgi:hypothetical protein
MNLKDFCDVVAGVLSETVTSQSVSSSTPDTIIFTAEKLREIRWMDYQAIRALCKGKNVKIDDSPSAYRELRWLNPQQISAIFGEGEQNGAKNNN